MSSRVGVLLRQEKLRKQKKYKEKQKELQRIWNA
jgi:hypothetical protein